jgi:hypothetical protein
MSNLLLHFPAEEFPILAQGSCLVLNANESIVTLVSNRHVIAQSQMSRSSFRLLVLLLKSPMGCYYAELFACLYCPEAVFQRVLRAPADQALKVLDPYIMQWSERLAALAEKGHLIYERELKRVRRLIKDKNSIHAIFQEQGFGLVVRVLYRKGYILRSSVSDITYRPWESTYLSRRVKMGN